MQTSVATAITAGREGARATAEPVNIITRSAQDTNGQIKPGRVVTRGASDNEAVLPDATGEISAGVVLGIAMWVPGREPGGALGQYLDNQAMPVMRKGVIWMLCETACAYGGAVFVRFTAEAPDLDIGTVRNDADTDKAVALPTAQFRGTLSAAGLVQVEINLP